MSFKDAIILYIMIIGIYTVCLVMAYYAGKALSTTWGVNQSKQIKKLKTIFLVFSIYYFVVIYLAPEPWRAGSLSASLIIANFIPSILYKYNKKYKTWIDFK